MTLLLVALIGVLVVPVVNAPAAEARTNSKSKPVILVHGVKISSSGASCKSFGAYKNFLDNHGWARHKLQTVGYYDGRMDGCNVDLRKWGRNHCHNPSEFDEDVAIWHISCRLAWAIYHKHSKHGRTVDIVGHSMGGLVVRWALGKVQAGDSNYPPYLRVEDVLTMGTPHNGTGWAKGCDGSHWWEPDWRQCKQMKPNSGFIDAITSRWYFRNPQPWPNHNTDWTVMGSKGDSIVSACSATGCGMPRARHKVIWKVTCHYHGRSYVCHDVGHTQYKDITHTHKHMKVKWKKGNNSWVHVSEDFWPAMWSIRSLKYGPHAKRG